MYDYTAAAERLWNHSGLPVTKNEKGLREESLSYQLWVADQQRTRPNLALVDDVVSCLIVLNTHFNGSDPDARFPGPRRLPIPDTVAYSVTCIVVSSLSYHRKWSGNHEFPEGVLCALLTGIHKIAYCWMQVLAGDVSDLLEGFE